MRQHNVDFDNGPIKLSASGGSIAGLKHSEEGRGHHMPNRDFASLERLASLDRRLATAPVETLKQNAQAVPDRVPPRKVPAWDRAD